MSLPPVALNIACCSPRKKSHLISVVHFNGITVFKALKCRAFIKGGARTHYTDMSGTHAVALHV